MARWALNRFAGVDTETDTHLLGHYVAAMRNLIARGGRLQTRRGFVRAANAADEIGPAGVSLYPSLIFSFDPTATGNESADDGSSAIEVPEDPYGTVEEPPDPVVDDGAIIGGVDPEEDDSIWSFKPDDDAVTVPIQAWIPGAIYDRCPFTIRFASTGFDGTGADVDGYSLDAAGAIESAALNLGQSITSGWTDGLWESTGMVEVDTDQVFLMVICSAENRPGQSCSATILLPGFSVSIPTTGTPTGEFSVTITCNQTNYAGDGYGMTLSFERYNAATDAWVALSMTGLASPTSGWTDGVWSDACTFGDLNGSTLVRAKLEYPGRSGDTVVYSGEMAIDLSESVSVDIPAAVDAFEFFYLDIEVTDAAGNPADNFDSSRLSIAWEWSLNSTGPWSSWTPDVQEALPATFASGTASVGITLAEAPIQADSYIRVAVTLDGETTVYDTAFLDVDYDTQVKLAIWERQAAISIAAGSRIDTEGSYTMAQLIGEANLFMSSYPGGTSWVAAIYNSWSGGSTVPTGISSNPSYFGTTGSGAVVEVDTAKELFIACIPIRRIKASLSTTGADMEEYEGYDSATFGVTEAEAKAAAQADWAAAALGNTMPYAMAQLLNPIVGSWGARIQLTRCRVSSSLRVGTDIARRIRQFYICDALDEWGNHGYSVDTVYEAYTDETQGAGDSNQGEYPGSSSALSGWPIMGAEPAGSKSAGFAATAGFAIVDPSFTY